MASLLLFAAGTAWADDASTIRLCTDSEDVYPWTLKSRPGLNDILLRIVESKTGQLFDLVSEPWQRCQEELRVGTVDGMYAISFASERLAIGVYPMRDNAADPAKRLMMDGYSLFRRQGDQAVVWDGKLLTVHGKVGAERGRSVISQLQSLGMQVDSGSNSLEANFRKLLMGRVDAVAWRSFEGGRELMVDREFADKVERLPVLLSEKPFYLVFSRQFATKHEKLVHDIWDAVERVRESPEYRVIELSFR
ncbi:MAG: hypothetical protein JO002_12510 [Burkholderiaceae bacterium]|nr:hypothetical protein [Burkholderiaceae bacterium]